VCEYCGCRDNPEIALLGAQHDAIVDLADQVMESVRSGNTTMLDAVSRLSELLIPHVRREEAGVFRVAEEIGLGNEYVDDLEDDHRRFDALLAQPESLDAGSLESLLDDLYRHIAVEEYDLFPVVAKELNAGYSMTMPALLGTSEIQTCPGGTRICSPSLSANVNHSSMSSRCQVPWTTLPSANT
jgi:hemerythrin-like domain-containing protein